MDSLSCASTAAARCACAARRAACAPRRPWRAASARCAPATARHRDTRLRAMLEEIDEAFVALDWEYRYVHVNEAALRSPARRSTSCWAAASGISGLSTRTRRRARLPRTPWSWASHRSSSSHRGQRRVARDARLPDELRALRLRARDQLAKASRRTRPADRRPQGKRRAAAGPKRCLAPPNGRCSTSLNRSSSGASAAASRLGNAAPRDSRATPQHEALGRSATSSWGTNHPRSRGPRSRRPSANIGPGRASSSSAPRTAVRSLRFRATEARRGSRRTDARPGDEPRHHRSQAGRGDAAGQRVRFRALFEHNVDGRLPGPDRRHHEAANGCMAACWAIRGRAAARAGPGSRLSDGLRARPGCPKDELLQGRRDHRHRKGGERFPVEASSIVRPGSQSSPS